MFAEQKYDIGIITLPTDRRVAIAVFVSDSPADEATREGVIAKIAKAVFEAVSSEQTKRSFEFRVPSFELESRRQEAEGRRHDRGAVEDSSQG